MDSRPQLRCVKKRTKSYFRPSTRRSARRSTRNRSCSSLILFQSDRAVTQILDADYTFVDETLAKHYGIPGWTGPQWRRVDGVRKYGRGGILGLAKRPCSAIRRLAHQPGLARELGGRGVSSACRRRLLRRKDRHVAGGRAISRRARSTTPVSRARPGWCARRRIAEHGRLPNRGCRRDRICARRPRVSIVARSPPECHSASPAFHRRTCNRHRESA